MPPEHNVIGSQWHIGAMCQMLVLAGNGFSIRQIYPLLTTSTAHAQVFGKAYCTNFLTTPPSYSSCPFTVCLPHTRSRDPFNLWSYITSFLCWTTSNSSHVLSKSQSSHGLQVAVCSASPTCSCVDLKFDTPPLLPFPSSHRWLLTLSPTHEAHIFFGALALGAPSMD